ncbi:MAG: cyclic nucleotide-binding domain-containing protein [Arcicella sp.]|nr:cyclic nucleotide-binding domain-containing protein [Arcicella sp.]
MRFTAELEEFRYRLSVLGISYQEDDLKIIAPLLKIKSFKKGDIILQKGEICQEVYFIVEGLMRSFDKLPNGNEKTYVICFENQIFTEHTSFISQKPATEFLEALEDTEVVFFTYQDLMKVYEISHRFESIGRKLSEINFITTKNKLITFMNDDAKKRYEVFLKTYQKVLPRIPQNIISSFLGITPQSLSRLKREMNVH